MWKNEKTLIKMQIETRKIDDIKAIEINDHILAFYAGRDWTRLRDEPNWLDDGAMKLGIATYAIHKNRQAVIYDTFADIRQAMWVRDHLEHMGIKHFTVVLSHWRLDHIAGNEVYKDCNIISNDKDFLMSPMKSYLREELEQGWVHYYEPYEAVHNENREKVYG